MNTLRLLLPALLLGSSLSAPAQEASIRKNLGERIPAFQKIDEISKTPIAGLYEVRINGAEILYTDADGSYLIQGNLIDTRQKRNLTEERIEKLTAIDFAALPLKDAFTVVRGNGARKMAIFEDPNCGYCKRFERDLQKIDNVTVYLFLLPILGPDSLEKSKNIWCAKDKSKVWTDWMVRDLEIAANGPCDTTALERNVQFSRKYRINGTPASFFVNGRRVAGAAGSADIEKHLSEIKVSDAKK